MTSFDGLDRRLSARLDERAAPRAPDGLSEAITERVDGTAQRPAWATLERWIPMETRAQFGAVPRAVVVLALLALLTLVTATAIAIGSSTPSRLPPPFGPAGNGLIAFESAGDVYVVEPDGSGLRQITSDPVWQGEPTWSRDGTELAYWTGPDEGPLELVVTDAEGRDPLVIAEAPTDINGTTWSADGSEIMFSTVVPELVPEDCPVRQGAACGSRIFVARTDGSGWTMVGDPDLDARGPALSPDGHTVAFGGGKAAYEALYLMKWDGTDIRRLETGIPGDTWAFAKQSWSPDGRHIATHDGLGVQSIWLVDLDEAGTVADVTKLATGFWPEYAPDGSRVQYWLSFTSMAVAEPGSEDAPAIIPADDGYWAPDASRFVGLKGTDLVTLERDGEDLVTIATIEDGSAAWQRVAP